MSRPENPPSDPHDTLPPSQDPAVADGAIDAPTRPLGILRKLGPGLIIAGSIVGSGELIATTKVGAEAGITLLWLIVIGCVIKVFVQIELGRFSISHGETTLSALNRVPGKIGPANWIVWFWLAMMTVGLAQLGGIVGGVGQALALTWPIQGDYVAAVKVPSEGELKRYLGWEEDFASGKPRYSALTPEQRERVDRGHALLRTRLGELGAPAEELIAAVTELRQKEKAADEARKALREARLSADDVPDDGATLARLAREAKVATIRAKAEKQIVAAIVDPPTLDDKIWAAVATLLTIGLLCRGKYRIVQNISVVLVVTFTFLTIGNVISLQYTKEWHISAEQFLSGLKFGLPDVIGNARPIATALAAFGIIGVGASELISYPYWCLEKGYAKFTGPRNDSPAWTRRALGWMRVMHWDVFLSMIVYTIATLAFFIMGAAVLFREGRNPDGMRMVNTLAASYVPVFGEYAGVLFLVGAVAVLYSTFMVAIASHSRTLTDALKVFGLMRRGDQKLHDRSVSTISVLWPLICFVTYVLGVNPVAAVLLSGVMQATLLPMICVGALMFRYKLTDARLRPGKLWDVMLIASCLAMLVTGAWGVYEQFAKWTGT
ncbi:MAG: Nramp family divalent metal transporter [Planctomycetaceae bacterium]